EDDSGASGVVAVEARVLLRFDRGGDREQDVAVKPAGVLRGHGAARVEVLDLGGDTHREAARVERLDEVDPALARDGRAPGRRRVVPARPGPAQPLPPP